MATYKLTRPDVERLSDKIESAGLDDAERALISGMLGVAATQLLEEQPVRALVVRSEEQPPTIRDQLTRAFSPGAAHGAGGGAFGRTSIGGDE